jgi:glycosyltransferase involved in cell wall biosynthesis
MSERLRVVHLIDQLNYGGAERFTVHVVSGLDPDRFDRTLCATRRSAGRLWTPERRAETMAELAGAGVRTLELNRDGRWDLAAWRPLVRVLRRERVQILHAHMFGSSAWGTVIARLARVPVVVVHDHGSPPDPPLSRRMLERHLLGRHADAYLAVCEPDRLRHVALGVPEERTHVLANGIVAPRLDPDRDVRAELGIAADAPVVGTVGVLRSEKAHEVLLQAAAQVRERHPALRVVVVGDGDRRDELVRLTAELGLEDAVLFPGVRDDVPDVLRAFDVAVNSSMREGSPLSVMEYMEAGLPVVATHVGGVPEIVRDGVDGLLVPPNEPDAMAGALLALLGDRDAAAAMGRSGQERRRAEYDLDVTTRRLGELYERLWAER